MLVKQLRFNKVNYIEYLPSVRRLLFFAAGQDNTDCMVTAVIMDLKNNIMARSFISFISSKNILFLGKNVAVIKL